MARYLLKNHDLIDSIKAATARFSKAHKLTSSIHFSKLLGFTSDTAQQQYLNLFAPYGEKHLKADELLMIIRECGEHSKPILDFLAYGSGFQVLETQEHKPVNQTIELTSINLQVLLGDFSLEVMQDMQDGLLNDDELLRLRQKLIALNSFCLGAIDGINQQLVD